MQDLKRSTTTANAVAPEKLYESDFFAWTQQQTSLLQAKQWSDLDVPNLIEEIESLGKQQRQEMRNFV